MTDRELLEAAAKAAGIEFDGEWSETDRMSVRRGGFWNPLTDDGDALRLAVKLAIDFKVRNGATWWDYQESPGVVYWNHETHNGEPYAATRRAIVRAAAAMAEKACI